MLTGSASRGFKVLNAYKKTDEGIVFLCQACGACCRVISCKYLTSDNKCSIYEKRPIVCRVDKMFEITGGGTIMDRKEYYKLSKLFCEFLRQKEKGE